MSSNSEDFSNHVVCEFSTQDDHYQPINNQFLSVVNFTPAFFFFSSTSTGWSKEINHIGEMSFELLWIANGILRSISLERARENKKPSHPPLRTINMHPNCCIHSVRFSFHFYLRCMLSYFKCALVQLSPLVWCAMIGMYIIWKQKHLSYPTF